MSDYSNNDLARKLSALESQMTELRRLVTDLPARIVAAEPKPTGVSVVQGGLFMPGTGTINEGPRTLSAEAQAALDLLDQTDDPSLASYPGATP